MTNEDWIQFNGMCKKFNQYHQVGEISLSLRKGEIFALCGGNGAGKSTFIKMITGMMTATKGEIVLEGKVINPKSMEYRQLFAYMPDNMLFPSQLTGKEILTYYARLRKVDEKRVLELLQLLGLEEVKDRYIKHYSKGMQQRLSFAQTILGEAPLLILDEPTNGLDPYWFYRFKEILLEEKKKGKTILLTTHILSFVEEIADTVAFLDKGKVIKKDRIENLINHNGRSITLEELFFQQQKKSS